MNIRLIVKIFVVIISFSVFNSAIAVPTDKEGKMPALFSAILKEDVELYSQEMEKLLNQPIKKFTKTILFRTDKGDTIFHLIAGVRSQQEFFAQEMKNLIYSMSSRLLINYSGDLSLGGLKIIGPVLEDTELGQAVMGQDTSAILSIVKRLDDTSAIEVLSFLRASSRAGESIKGFAWNYLSLSQLLYLRDQNLEQKIEKYDLDAFFVMSQKNKEGYKTIDIANKLENFSVATLITGRPEALISAILKEDVELYSQEMEKLLINQPINKNAKTLLLKKAFLFRTDKGDTIFHLMAGVRSQQEFFAQEMGNLLNTIKKYKSPFDFLSKRNKKDLQAIDIANKAGNLFASSVITYHKGKDADNSGMSFMPGIAIGLLLPASYFLFAGDSSLKSGDPLVDTLIMGGGMLGGMVLGSFSSTACYKLFHKTKAKRLHKKAMSQKISKQLN